MFEHITKRKYAVFENISKQLEETLENVERELTRVGMEIKVLESLLTEDELLRAKTIYYNTEAMNEKMREMLWSEEDDQKTLLANWSEKDDLLAKQYKLSHKLQDISDYEKRYQ